MIYLLVSRITARTTVHADSSTHAGIRHLYIGQVDIHNALGHLSNKLTGNCIHSPISKETYLCMVAFGCTSLHFVVRCAINRPYITVKWSVKNRFQLIHAVL